jgi:hypothetical protein
VETIGLDGTITLRTKYHALSRTPGMRRISDPAPEATYAREVKDGHCV